jgi:hypothetical protein
MGGKAAGMNDVRDMFPQAILVKPKALVRTSKMFTEIS